jgi:hypothetical protein
MGKKVKRKPVETLGVINKLLARSVEQRAIAADSLEFTQQHLAELCLEQKPSKKLVKAAEKALETAKAALAYYERNTKELQKRQASAMKAIAKAQA